MPFPNTERNENDAEHSFALGIIALSIEERMQLGLDRGLIAQYALIHDLIEVYAGDVSARDHKNYHKKHASELNALKRMSQKFKATQPWMVELINSYENRADDESRFVYAIDKIMGAIVMTASGETVWENYYPEPDGSSLRKTINALRKKAEAFPELLSLFDHVHDYLDKERLIYHSETEGAT